MHNITSIGIENFRVFNKMTNIDLAPITILTGANNTGKSSFLKLLKLLKDNNLNSSNLLEINLTVDENIKIINNNLHFFNYNNQKEIFTFETKIGRNILVTLKYRLKDKNTLFFNSLNIHNLMDNIELVSYNSTITANVNACKLNIFFNIPEFRRLFLNVDNFFKFNSLDKNNILSILLFQKGLKYSCINFFNIINLKKYIDNNLWEHDETKLFLVDFENILIEEYFTKIESNSSNNYNEDIINIYKTHDPFLGDRENLADENSLSPEIDKIANERYFVEELGVDIIDYYKDNFEIGLLNFSKLKEKYPLQYSAIEKSSLFDILNPDFEKYVIKVYLFNRVLEIINSALFFNELTFINIDRASQDRLFLYDGSTLLHKKLSEFVKSDFHNSDDIHFVNHVLKEMEITDKCYIEAFEYGATVKIKKGKHKVDLADCGFGVTQIFILAISMVLSKGQTLVLEEPEANLHPKLQSKLADIISIGHKVYNNNFIIETHSEYLIRKLQYLTAKKEIKPEDTVIHYFNSTVSKKEELIKKITIKEDGTLSSDFGKGFLDEADNISMDLFKFQQANKN